MFAMSAVRWLLLPVALSLGAAELKIEVVDEAGKPLWSRLEVRGSDGKMFQPEGAIRDKTAQVKVSGPSWYQGHFVVEGKVTLDLCRPANTRSSPSTGRSTNGVRVSWR